MRLFMFPGQGCHFLGMGKDLLQEKDPLFLELLDLGSEMAKESLEKVALDGPFDHFCSSRILQPLISAISLSYFARLMDRGVTPDLVMGHSLGEITALGAVGVISPQEVVRFAAFRGVEMDRCAQLMGGGGMWAVLLGNAEEVQQALACIGVDKELFVANDNAPTQTVIAGSERAFDTFKEYADTHLSVRLQRLPVAGPWHTPFITPGRDAFAAWVADKMLNSAQIPLLMNGPREVVTAAEEIRAYITEQLIRPVFWRESLQKAVSLGVTEVYEVGPGAILTGLLRANKLNKSFASIHTIDSLNAIGRTFATIEHIKQECGRTTNEL